MGGPERSPGEALAALKEAMEVIRLAWSEERGLRYDGEQGLPFCSRDVCEGPVQGHHAAGAQDWRTATKVPAKQHFRNGLESR